VAGDAGVESHSIARAVVAREAEKFAVRDAAVATGRAGVVEVAASTPAFDGFGVDAEFRSELTDCVRPWHPVVANYFLLLVKDS